MGQRQVGRMPQNCEALYEEWRRVLHWSAEVIARADDNILQEDSFLMDYDNDNISNKVDAWLLQVFDENDTVQSNIQKLVIEIKFTMRKSYDKAYEDLRKFTRIVDNLADNQRHIHRKILDLDKILAMDVKKFRRKLGLLRLRVFKNLRTSEKMIFRDRRLKKEFASKVYDIDRENRNDLQTKAKKLIVKN